MHYWHHLPVVPHFQDRVEIEELFSLFGSDTSVDESGLSFEFGCVNVACGSDTRNDDTYFLLCLSHRYKK